MREEPIRAMMAPTTMYERIRPIAIRLLRGDTLRLEARAGHAWTATADSLTEDGNEPFIESDAFEVARAIIVMELRPLG